jgi:hypothetical protein
MRFRPPAFVAVTLSALVLGGGAYAAASSIDTQPAPKVVVPNAPASNSSAGHLSRGADDPATHDINDDKGGLRPTTHNDDPATHDINDDHGRDGRGSGSGHNDG